MAIIKIKELKGMQITELKEKLVTYKSELSDHEGTRIRTKRPDNPGKYKELKRTIARILTLIKQKEAKQPVKSEAPNKQKTN